MKKWIYVAMVLGGCCWLWVGYGCGGGSTGTSSSSQSGSSFQVTSCSSDLPSVEAKTPTAPAGYTGELYEGPIYETSFQAGDGGSTGINITQLVENMNRNNVVRALAMFSIDAEDSLDMTLGTAEGIDYMKNALVAAPCRFVPYTVRGNGEVNSLDTSNLTSVFDRVSSLFGGQVLRGIGELEFYLSSWDLMDADDSRLTAVYDLAQSRGVHIFGHWAGGPDSLGPATTNTTRSTSELSHLETIFGRYPNLKFLFHLFPTHIETAIFDLMNTYTNFYFSVDIDHVMQRIPWECGLLDCYENDADAKTKFIEYFDANVQAMLDQAVERYKPLIEAHPNQFMLGMENVGSYSLDPDVYDRSISFARAFIAQLDSSVREKVAYQNAERVFGAGAALVSN